MPKFYITTTLPYVNAAPHIGFALEIVQADAIARYRRLMGDEVFFNTGTDEHGIKILRKAQEEKKDPQAYVDEYAAKFDRLKTELNLSYDNFIRTTDPHHVAAAQEFWRRCNQNGDIYKQEYEIKYCVGCELEKTDSELADGKCPLHPNLELERYNEENYFFRFSKYQEPLLKLYSEHPDFVLPEHRLTEIKNFVAAGLQDFSISRLKSKMPWGIPVPGDEDHVMYVWFDALINYVSALGWPESVEDSKGEPDKFTEFWGSKSHPNAVQIAGKDNLRQQSAIWQSMLMSASLPNSKQILIHGFITSGGEKMSKSLGNVVDPFELVKKYGTDAVRYWLLKEVPTFDDADFTLERFEATYNADLANGLGNLVSRVMKMATEYGVSWKDYLGGNGDTVFHNYPGVWDPAYNRFDLKKVVDNIHDKIKALDVKIQIEEPYRKIKTDEASAKKDVAYLLSHLLRISYELEPFLPKTSLEIRRLVSNGEMPGKPLFPRIS